MQADLSERNINIRRDEERCI